MYMYIVTHYYSNKIHTDDQLLKQRKNVTNAGAQT